MMMSVIVFAALCISSMFNKVIVAADLISLDKYVGEDARFTWQSINYLEFKFGLSNAAQDDIDINGALILWVRGNLSSGPNNTDVFYQGRLYFYGDPSPSADSKHFDIKRVTVLDEKVYLVAIMDPTSRTFTVLRAWNLTIREAPSFNPPLSGSHDVAEDTDFSITCSASGRPAPNVTWVNKTSGSPVAHGTGSATLSLPKIQRHQAGVYQCQAINDVGRGAITQDITINVQYPPEITPIQNTTVRAGKTITLTCAVAGNPTPSVSWSKAGSGHSTGGNVFTKAGATKADTGQYVCTAVNTVTGNTQTRTASTYVMVKYKPSIISSYPGQTVNETIDFLKLTCNSDGYPAPTVTWSRDGLVVSRTSVYYSNSVTRSEAGTYTCTATNEMGSDTTTVQVTVNYKPEMVSLTTNTSFWNKKILSLQCKARGVPSPQITWYKPGDQPITAGVSPISGGSQLQVTTTQDAGDYGQYKCQASNLLGSVERLIYVTQLCAKNESEPFVRSSESCVAVTAACSTVIAVLLVSNLMSLVYIYRTGRSKQESRIPRGALNSAAIDEDPITMNTIDLVTNTTSASSDVTYKNHGSPYDEVTATSTYKSLDRTTRTYPDGRGQARGPREYEAVGGSGPERGGEGRYAELTSTCPDYQPLHIYGNVGGAKGHRGMGTNV